MQTHSPDTSPQAEPVWIEQRHPDGSRHEIFVKGIEIHDGRPQAEALCLYQE